MIRRDQMGKYATPKPDLRDTIRFCLGAGSVIASGRARPRSEQNEILQAAALAYGLLKRLEADGYLVGLSESDCRSYLLDAMRECYAPGEPPGEGDAIGMTADITDEHLTAWCEQTAH